MAWREIARYMFNTDQQIITELVRRMPELAEHLYLHDLDDDVQAKIIDTLSTIARRKGH